MRVRGKPRTVRYFRKRFFFVSGSDSGKFFCRRLSLRFFCCLVACAGNRRTDLKSVFVDFYRFNLICKHLAVVLKADTRRRSCGNKNRLHVDRLSDRNAGKPLQTVS